MSGNKQSGGLISTLQIKSGARLQFAVVPVNLVDRESHVPEFSFEQLSIPSQDKTHVRFAYPISTMAKDVPCEVSNILGESIWASRSFLSVDLPTESYEKLVYLHKHNSIEECDRFLISQGYKALDNRMPSNAKNARL